MCRGGSGTRWMDRIKHDSSDNELSGEVTQDRAASRRILGKIETKLGRILIKRKTKILLSVD